MSSTKSAAAHALVRAHAIAGVGRLLPAEGITVRPHPDRDTLLQFLQEVQLPLTAIDNFVELIENQALPPAVHEALLAIATNARELGELVGDYREFAWLEADQVVADPVATAPVRWLDGVVAGNAARAARLGCELHVVHRSFLPDAAVFDGDLAEQAVATLLRTAMRRALPGPVELQVAYDCASVADGVGRLCLVVKTRGGGFAEIEQGYAFTPFVALDRHRRPLLGLSVARRLCQLLGGALSIASTGANLCCYTMTLSAPAAPGASWVDPLVPGGQRLGLIQPDR